MKLLVITLQFCFAGFHNVSRVALNIGVSKVVYPERAPLTISLLVQFFLLALIGITANQGFYLLGLTYASPTFASAMQNTVTAITIIMACALRIKHINLVRRHVNPRSHNWTLGCLYLMGHCLSWAGWMVLQAPVLKNYPASLLCLSKLIPRNWIIVSWEELFTILYAGIVASGLVVYLQTWCMYKGGPVFVAAFLPLQTLLVAGMTFVLLGDQLYSGSIVAAMFIMLGLYLVLWSKTEERRQVNEESNQEEEDHESLTRHLLGDVNKEAQQKKDSESLV
ncbi:hypothetical protein EUTSA_v10012396mg [Eutrema salsugineum]|uniref:Uncharacterized protein n=1 Tax=Eutrema salsugineum TaxID=72664 RepID=V4KL47_EUTSA|nr:hypothetical protein EUTSA_v10012396mg [Eutrema salsugineum]